MAPLFDRRLLDRRARGLACLALLALAACGGDVEVPPVDATSSPPRPATDGTEAPGAQSAAGQRPQAELGSAKRPSSDEFVAGELQDDGWLREVTGELGLSWIHEPGSKGELHLPEVMGGGAALLDHDLDGDLDIYFVNGGEDGGRPERSGDVQNSLWRNEAGRALKEVPGAGGAPGAGYGMGAAVGDADGDGRVDLYVSAFGRDQLFRNVEGRFEDVSSKSGVQVGGWSCSAAFLDVDRDGDLDLWVTQYVAFVPGKRCFDHADRRDYCGPTSFDPLPDVLLRNEGGGRFVDVSRAAGIAGSAAAGLGVVVEDFDEDGLPDVYVANDTYSNHLWMNRGDGTFLDDGVILGVALNLHGNHEAGMGVLAEDFDADGRVDLFMTHLTRETNTLYRNLGPERGFIDATGASGLAASSRALTGFGTAVLDLETDGDLDLLVVNGRVGRGEPRADAEQGEPWKRYAEPNLLYVNRGEARFASYPERARAFTDRVEVSRGLLVGDLDGDGDNDVVLTSLAAPARVYFNESPIRQRWLKLGVRDPRVGRSALGAVVRLELQDRVLMRSVRRASGYLTSQSPDVRFAFPSSALPEAGSRLLVTWPDGVVERFAPDGVDRSFSVVRGEGRTGP